MDKCSDPKFEKMLHAYELGLISDSDLEELEMHLIKCDYCFRKVQDFENKARQIRQYPEMRVVINKIVSKPEGQDNDTSKEAISWFDHNKWKRLLPIFAAVAVIVVALIFWPGNLEIFYTDEAVADDWRLLITYFDDFSEAEDDTLLGEIATNLLISDLGESEYIQIVSRQRLHDIMRDTGEPGAKNTGPDFALEAAKRANAKWLLTGSIVRKNHRLILASHLVDAKTGDIIASQKISGDIDEDMFSLIDKLAVAVKDDLSLPKAARMEPDPAIAEITSHSEEAYRLYLVGLDYKNRFLYENARESFKNALIIDSTLSMAYYHLSWIVSGVAQDKAISKAVAFSENAGWKDRYYINGRQAFLNDNYRETIRNMQAILDRSPDEKEAYYQIGFCYDRGFAQYDSALIYLKNAVALDSLYGRAYNVMAYVYNRIGDLKRALEAIDQYIAISPDEANPYDSKSDILMQNGLITEAITAAEKAVEIRPDFYHTIEKLGILYIYNKQYEKAAECFHTLASGSDSNYRMKGRQYLPLIPLYQGKFSEALQVLDDVFAADRIEKNESMRATILNMTMQLYIYFQKGDYKTGLSVSRQVMELYHRADTSALIYLRDGYVHFLAAMSKFDEAKTVAEEIRVDIETKDPDQIYHYWYVMGITAFAEKEYDTALDYLSRTYDIQKDISDIRLPPTIYWTARAYQESEELETAARLYESLLSTYDEYRLFWATISIMSHYRLGRVYEEMGQIENAIRQYREFIDIWENADYGREYIEDAVNRLSNLRG